MTADLRHLEVTAQQLADLAGVTPRHINRLIGGAKCGRNRWKLHEAFPALLESLSGGDAGGELTKERCRLVKAQADRAEMEYALAKKEIAPISEMKRAMALRCSMIQARVMQLPRRTLTALIGERDEGRFRAVMTAECKLALTEAAAEELTPEMVDDTDTNDLEPEEGTE